MRTRASVGNHPIHPMLVPLPIGAFALALVGDVAYASSAIYFWYAFAFVAMGVGILGAALAVPFGLADYLSIPGGTPAKRTATVHLTINVLVVLVYVMNWLLRRGGRAADVETWPLVFLLEVGTFTALAVSGWLGGRLVYEEKVGVPEPEAHPVPPGTGTPAKHHV